MDQLSALSNTTFPDAPMATRPAGTVKPLELHQATAVVPPAEVSGLTPRFVAIATLLSVLHGLLVYWLLVWLGVGSQRL